MEEVEISRHIFKVLMPGFHTKLKLPPGFCEKLKEEKSEWAMLKSREGRWRIQVCRNCEGLIRFKGGWPQFVDDHSLSVGDFLVFEHVGGLKFNVLVFDPSCCEKKFAVESKSENEAVNIPSIRRRPIEAKNVISYDSRNPNFITTMKPHHAKTSGALNIPVEFVRSNNLGKKTNASLRDGCGRVWPINLRIGKVGQIRVRFGIGWLDFYTSNKLKTGDVCVFYLNPGSPRSKSVLFDVEISPLN